MMSLVRFGWTTDNLPDYKVTMTPKDFDAESLMPTDEFVAKIGDKLVGDKDEDPRFAEIVNAKAIFPNRKQRADFQLNLVSQLHGYLRQTYPQLFDSLLKNWSNPENVKVGKSFYNLFLPVEKGEKGFPILPEFQHWDPQSNLIFSWNYLPTQNVLGGIPRVMDGRQLAKDIGVPLEKIMRDGESEGDMGGFIGKQYLQPDVLQKYAIPINPDRESILLVNNAFSAGIAHGRSMGYLGEPDQEGERPVQMSVMWVNHPD